MSSIALAILRDTFLAMIANKFLEPVIIRVEPEALLVFKSKAIDLICKESQIVSGSQYIEHQDYKSPIRNLTHFRGRAIAQNRVPEASRILLLVAT